MIELTDLQKDLLSTLNKLSKEEKELFGTRKTCDLTSKAIISKMKHKNCAESYLTVMLQRLEKKQKLKLEHKHIAGKGNKRIITIL